MPRTHSASEGGGTGLNLEKRHWLQNNMNTSNSVVASVRVIYLFAGMHGGCTLLNTALVLQADCLCRRGGVLYVDLGQDWDAVLEMHES